LSDTNKSVKNVAVIGGGAAGLIAAWAAAKNNSVFLIERNEKLGKKLYITGKGRCNITNTDDKDEFFRSVFRNPKFLYSAINAFSNQDIVRLIEANGVKTKVERGGRIFPESDKSSDVIRALTKNAEKAGVNIALNTRVKAVKKIENGFDIEFYSNPQSIPSKYDAVIICTGGKSYSSTGSTGDGYELARCFGHTIVELKPSLTGLCTNEQWVSDLQGLTLKNVQLTAYRNGKKIYSDMGEMLFTHFGVSGPLVLTLSGHIADDPIGVLLSIDLKPALSEKTLDKRILSDFDKHKHKLLKNALVDLLPSRMISGIISTTGMLVNSDRSVTITNTPSVSLSTIAFLPNFIIELSISAHTQARIPPNACTTISDSANSAIIEAISEIIIIEGSITPKVATTAPQKPFTLCPTNVAVFTAITPGVHWLMA
jgi:predicted Rossmann fold flavoprotein